MGAFFLGSGAQLVRGARECLLSESHTDCVLVSMEGVAVRVHRALLAPSATLGSILLDSSCCRGRCDNQSSSLVLLPEVPYRVLQLCVDFLYQGSIRCSEGEAGLVRQVLLEVLGVKKGLRVERKELPQGRTGEATAPWSPRDTATECDTAFVEGPISDTASAGVGSKNTAAGPARSLFSGNLSIPAEVDFTEDDTDEFSAEFSGGLDSPDEGQEPLHEASSPGEVCQGGREVCQVGPAGQGGGKRMSGQVTATQQESRAKKRRTSGTKKRCRTCQNVVASEHFKRHLVTHLYDRWSEVEAGEGRRDCDKCSKTFSNWKDLVVHMATKHGQLEVKLAERCESLSDHEMVEVGVDTEEERLQSLGKSSHKEVLKRHVGELPPDFFENVGEPVQEEHARVEDLLSDQVTG